MRLVSLLRRLADPFRRTARDREFADEVQAHLDLLTDEHLARGLPLHEARLAARRAFGGVDQVTAAYRDRRGLPWVETLVQDAGFGFRLLARDRGFAATAILVLALGIGVNNMFFTLVYAHAIRTLPIPRSERVLYLSTVNDQGADRPLSLPEFEEVRTASRSFEAVGAYLSAPVTIGDEGRAPDRFEATFVSPDAFPVVGVRPLAGRDFDEAEHRAGAPAVLLLSSSAWHSRYSADPGVIGRAVLLNGSPAVVVGVMPDESGFPSTAAVWVPLEGLPPRDGPARSQRTLRVIGRLEEGVSAATAAEELGAIFGRMEQAHPESNRGVRVRVMPIDERFLARIEGPWLAFLIAGCIIVLISAANVANLMLARGAARAHEFGIRTSLGAGRGRLIRQLLAEGTALAVLGGALGLGVSIAGVRLFRSGIPANVLPYWLHYDVDGRIVAALVLVSLGTVLIFALIPAIQASRLDVTAVLKDGGRSATSRREARRWTVAFLAVELGLAVVLLAQVALASLTSRSTTPSDEVVRTTAVTTAALTLPAARYATAADRAAFHRRLIERLHEAPGIAAVSVASALPLSGGPDRTVTIQGRALPPGAAPSATVVDVSAGYFDTLGLPIERGRPLSEHDGRPGAANVLVNETFVRTFLDGQEPLGQRLALATAGAQDSVPEWLTIVGIAPLVRQRPSPDPVPVVYRPIAEAAPASTVLLVRSTRETGQVVTVLREAVLALDPNVPLYRVQTLEAAVDDAQWNGRVSERLALTLTLLSVLLATVGLYAVTAHTVGLRSQEIGIRMALGARPAQVVRVVVESVRVPLILGFALGVAGSLAWDRAFSTGRAGLRVSDPQALAIIGAILALVTLIACYVPARRATRLDPVDALRQD